MEIGLAVDTDWKEDSSHAVWTRTEPLCWARDSASATHKADEAWWGPQQEKTLAGIWQWKAGSPCKHCSALQLGWEPAQAGPP